MFGAPALAGISKTAFLLRQGYGGQERRDSKLFSTPHHSIIPLLRIPFGMQKTPFRYYEKEFKRHSLSPVLAGSGSAGIISALPIGKAPREQGGRMPCGVFEVNKKAVPGGATLFFEGGDPNGNRTRVSNTL